MHCLWRFKVVSIRQQHVVLLNLVSFRSTTWDYQKYITHWSIIGSKIVQVENSEFPDRLHTRHIVACTSTLPDLSAKLPAETLRKTRRERKGGVGCGV